MRPVRMRPGYQYTPDGAEHKSREDAEKHYEANRVELDAIVEARNAPAEEPLPAEAIAASLEAAQSGSLEEQVACLRDCLRHTIAALKAAKVEGI